MKKHIYMSLIAALLSSLTFGTTACSSSDDASKDMTYPVISDQGIEANPIDCQVYQRGSVIPFHYLFTDDTELGNFNIEIHGNHDHHSHSTSSVECEDEHHEEEHAEPVNPWTFNKEYTIPAGLRSFTARFDIPIPADIDAGDYHFMIRLTDATGWQQLKAVAIEIE
jgi:hypothetical protein